MLRLFFHLAFLFRCCKTKSKPTITHQIVEFILVDPVIIQKLLYLSCPNSEVACVEEELVNITTMAITRAWKWRTNGRFEDAIALYRCLRLSSSLPPICKIKENPYKIKCFLHPHPCSLAYFVSIPLSFRFL